MIDTGDALTPGTRLEEFEIERVLGAGGFGVTYLARNLSLDAWRAVKEYLPRDWGTRLRDGTLRATPPVLRRQRVRLWIPVTFGCCSSAALNAWTCWR